MIDYRLNVGTPCAAYGRVASVRPHGSCPLRRARRPSHTAVKAIEDPARSSIVSSRHVPHGVRRWEWPRGAGWARQDLPNHDMTSVGTVRSLTHLFPSHAFPTRGVSACGS